MPSINTKKLAYAEAKLFRDSIQQSSNVCPVLYVSIGNHVPYTNEASPDSITDTSVNEKLVWDNIFAAKRVSGNDTELVVPRINWTSNTKYRQYDDTILFSDLISANSTQNLKPLYVITSDRNVYKCLSNNSSANSTIEPTGDYTTSNGNIATADGYVWKYLYNIKPSNKFLTESWMPAPSAITALDYSMDQTGVVDGELTTIVVTSKGTNYRQASNIKVDSFATGQSSIKLANTSLVLEIFNISTLSNLANMAISGTGIPTDTYISSISNITGEITLSANTNAFGGNANNISISTRIFIDGDGTGAVATATLSNTTSGITSANANISSITVTTIGTGYSRANVFVFGSGANANARAIISPKYGHGFNPAKELGANNTMVAVRIGELDSTENGLISDTTSFRQIGLIRNPYKYGANTPVNITTANSVISQTTDLTVVAGLSYTLNEYVYQGGTANNATAYGFVNAQATNNVRLTRVKGTFTPGLPLIGATSGVSRTITTIDLPEFQPYSGDVLYVENTTKTDRADGQAENIKLIISF